MSAPLVINLRDGSVWERRAATSSGLALYALAGSPSCCPPQVMATEAELAEHGIVGSADVLPVPAGPEPQALSVEQLRAELVVSEQRSERRRIAWRMARSRAISAGGAADRYAARSRDAQDAVQHMLFAVLAGQLAMHEANRERQELRARVAELEAERHSTNEVLSDVMVERSADRLTALFAPTQVLGATARQLAECSVCRAPRADWCPDCGVCAANCYGLRETTSCSHARAPWVVRDA